MREIRQSGSEGGEITKVIFPTPIHPRSEHAKRAEAWESKSKRRSALKGPFSVIQPEPSLQDGGYFRNRPRPALSTLTPTWAL